MTTPAAPHVDCEQHHPALSVSDVLAAADFYTSKLGFILGFTWGDPPHIAAATRVTALSRGNGPSGWR